MTDDNITDFSDFKHKKKVEENQKKVDHARYMTSMADPGMDQTQERLFRLELELMTIKTQLEQLTDQYKHHNHLLRLLTSISELEEAMKVVEKELYGEQGNVSKRY